MLFIVRNMPKALPASSADSDPAQDPVLIQAIREGDVEAYTTLFRAYYPRLLRFLSRHTSRDIAEDLVQDTLVRLWERRRDLDPGRSLRAYLFTAARNRALMLGDHQRVVQAHAESVMHAHVAHAPAADAELLVQEIVQVAERHLAGLTARQQEIWHLSRTDGLSPAEIAEVLGITVSTVYVQLARVVQTLFPVLREWLNEPE